MACTSSWIDGTPLATESSVGVADVVVSRSAPDMTSNSLPDQGGP
jgi:hypothetical protein